MECTRAVKIPHFVIKYAGLFRRLTVVTDLFCTWRNVLGPCCQVSWHVLLAYFYRLDHERVCLQDTQRKKSPWLETNWDGFTYGSYGLMCPRARVGLSEWVTFGSRYLCSFLFQISFLDYMAYLPLFLSIHQNICENALDMSRNKYQRKGTTWPQYDMQKQYDMQNISLQRENYSYRLHRCSEFRSARIESSEWAHKFRIGSRFVTCY